MTRNEIPSGQLEAFARCLLPAIQAFFESEAGQQEFEQWKAKQRLKFEGSKEQKAA